MPIAASSPSVSGSIAAFGSSCTSWLTSSKNEKSIAWMVFMGSPETLTNVTAGGSRGLSQGVDAHLSLDGVHGWRGVALDQEAAQRQEVAEGLGPVDVVPLVGQRTFVAGRHEQEPAALPVVGSGQPMSAT